MSEEVVKFESELAVCNHAIHARFGTIRQNVREVAGYVAEVLDKELWRQGGFKNGAAWGKAEFGWSRQRLHQIRSANTILLGIPDEVSTPFDASEKAIRALGKVPKSKRVRVFKKAAKSGKVTAKSIAEAAAQESGPTANGSIGGVVVEGASMSAESSPGISQDVEERSSNAELESEVALKEAHSPRVGDSAGADPDLQVPTECFGCARKDVELGLLRGRVEQLEALVAAENDGEIPDDTAEAPKPVVGPPRRFRCVHCGREKAVHQIGMACERCSEQGHEQKDVRECRGCQEGYAA